jgi:DNA (cytosine-5)-methyltransferase 1
MTAEVCTVGSLFSGIGGLDLGLERAGMSVRWQSEIDKYCCQVLAARWPTVPNLGDVRDIEWGNVENVELICGGYPCQPFSFAGKRGGLSDPRFLWEHFARALREVRPRYAILENVPGHLTIGFTRVLADLADLGFDAEWELLPAAAFGAPHLRYRLYTVAYASSARHEPERKGVFRDAEKEIPERPDVHRQSASNGPSPRRGIMARTGEFLEALQLPGFEDGRGITASGIVENVANADRRDAETEKGGPDAASSRRAKGNSLGGPRGEARRSRVQPDDGVRGLGEPKPAISDADGAGREKQWRTGASITEDTTAQFRSWWAIEPDVGRVANGVPFRVDRLRALGNAVVPQVAEFLGRAILEARSE